MKQIKNAIDILFDRFFFQEKSSLKLEEKVPLAVMIFLLIDIGLFSAYLTNYIIGEPFKKLTVFLDLNNELSIPTWYSTVKLCFISVLAGLFTYRYVSWEERKSWAIVLLPVLFLFLSMDEAVCIHERLGKKTDILLLGGVRSATFFHHTGIWMFIIGIPFLIGFLLFVFSIRDYFAVREDSFKKVVFGMIILLIGALGFEALSNYPSSYHSFSYHLITGCEETFEMVGGSIIFWGFYDIAKDSITIKKL